MVALKQKWQSLPQDQALNTATATEVLIGLRFNPDFVQQVIQGIETMEESTVYQAIFRKGEQRGMIEGLELGLEKGLERGLEIGKIELAQGFILEVLNNRFGSLSASIKTEVLSISDLDRLQRLMKAVNSVDQPEAILELH